MDSVSSKKASHYFGVQVNQLIQQIFNLSGNATTVINPYLINYSVNSNKTGWGLNLGIGYTINNLDQSSANNTVKTQGNNFSFRIGVERKVFIAKKIMVSYGFDLLSDRGKSNTTNASQFQFNTNETDTDAKTKDSGFGPRVTINYFVTPKIILGTEMTYYYKAITTFQEITNTSTTITVDPNTGQQTSNTNTSTTNSSQTNKQLNFASPVILFAILKF
jgi:hypothetical protein